MSYLEDMTEGYILNRYDCTGCEYESSNKTHYYCYACSRNTSLKSMNIDRYTHKPQCKPSDDPVKEDYPPSTIRKGQIHADICKQMNDVYKRKNADYGDSFAKMRNEIPNAILVRVFDKYCRLKNLMCGAKQNVADESIRDTLMDLANYCIMELVEMEEADE